MRKFWQEKIICSSLVLASLTAICGAVVYRLYSFNFSGLIISLVLTLLFSLIIVYFFHKSNKAVLDFDEKIRKQENKKTNFLLLTCYFLLTTFCFLILWRYASDGSINSPWNVVPPYFFIFYFLLTLNLLWLLARQTKCQTFLISLYYFLAFSIALVVYKIGYGFDPFIHQATVELIAKQGAVEPKPFYYLGQYALEIYANKFLGLKIELVDKFLVPFLAALWLPYSLMRLSKKYFSHKNSGLVVVVLLALTYPLFILTTPQNLAYLFLILVIIYGLMAESVVELIIVALIALAGLVTQPIAGLPACLLAAAFIFKKWQNKIGRRIVLSSLFVLNIFALPLAFSFLENKNHGAIFHLDNLAVLKNFFGNFLPNIPGKESFVLNFIYLIDKNWIILFLFLVGSGIFLTWREKERYQKLLINFYFGLAVFFSFVLANLLSFDYLISYERDDFPARLLIVATLIFCPFVLLSLNWFFETLGKQNKITKISFFVFLSALLSASLYLSYPRQDRYEFSHNYAVGKNEIDTVRWIADDAGDEKYIVLANQQVSAGALREFGFSHYLKFPSSGSGKSQSEVYFYPIPTSSPLYEYYLKMVYEKPSQKNIQKAMDLVGVDLGYFVLNKYWTDFPKILAEAKFLADSWQEIDGGEIYIFKYIK